MNTEEVGIMEFILTWERIAQGGLTFCLTKSIIRTSVEVAV